MNFNFRNIVIFVVSMLALSACGKGLHLTARAPLDGTNGLKVSTPVHAVDTGLAVKPTLPDQSLAQKFSGELTPVSGVDLQEFTAKLPYLNQEDPSNSVRTIGSPSFREANGTETIDYVKRSNLVFRATLQIPPKEAIKKVDRFAIQLKGLRKFSEKGADKERLRKQVLCTLDSLVCSGEKADTTDAEKKNLNPEFWSKAKVSTEVFSQLKTGQTGLSLSDSGETVTTPAADPVLGFAEGEETLDVRTLFGLEKLTDAELVDFIYSSSVPYANPGYRKFRFVIGNNTYIAGGNLVLQLEVDASKLPADFAQAAGLPLSGELDAAAIKLDPAVNSGANNSANGATSDASNQGDSEKPQRTDLEVVLVFEKLQFHTGSTHISTRDAERIRRTGLILNRKKNSIEAIRVVGQTDQIGSEPRNLELSLKRAKGVVSILKKAGVPESLMSPQGMGEVKTTSCAPWELCPEDRTVSLQFQLNSALTKEQKASLIQGLNLSLKKIWN